MKIVSRVGRAFYRILVDYCKCCSLAGVGNIGNHRYHWTERLFWIVCTLTGWIFAAQLIRTYVDLFRHDTISISLENVDTRWERTAFPAVGVCEMGYAKHVYSRLEEFMESLLVNEDMEYGYDVEDYMLRVIFHNLYNVGAMQTYCEPYENCADCVKCPHDGFRSIAARVRANCTELFSGCHWNGKPFDCCRYFLPVETTVGQCFLLNSLQTAEKYGKDWLRLEVDKVSPEGELLLTFNLAASTHIMNEEDIPHILLQSLQYSQIAPGYTMTVFMTLQDIVNDPLVRTVDTNIRRCRFPDENVGGSYPHYSYSVCVTACLRAAQIRMCNCCHYNMLLGDTDSGPACDYQGMRCLDEKDLIAPATKILQPWRTDGIVCHCYPSCNEKQIRIVGKQSDTLDGNERAMLIKLMDIPTQRYRRQIVREDIDVVVSIGGILGLFTGASLLSLAEFFYFFTVRFFSYVMLDKDDVDDEKDEEEERGEEDEEDEEEDDDDDEEDEDAVENHSSGSDSSHSANDRHEERYNNRYNVYN